MGRLHAEDANYWRTGKSSPDVWIDRAKKQIADLGGRVVAEGFGSGEDGRAAYMLGFTLQGDSFKIVWPVLPTWRGDEKSARVQAATMLYHYVKAVALYATVVGARSAFFTHFMLPDGRVASQVATRELEHLAPDMLMLTAPAACDPAA